MKTGAVYGRCYLQSRPFTTTAHYSDDGSKPQRLCMLASFASLSFFLTRCNIRHIFRSGEGGGGDRNEVSVGG